MLPRSGGRLTALNLSPPHDSLSSADVKQYEHWGTELSRLGMQGIHSKFTCSRFVQSHVYRLRKLFLSPSIAFLCYAANRHLTDIVGIVFRCRRA